MNFDTPIRLVWSGRLQAAHDEIRSLQSFGLVHNPVQRAALRVLAHIRHNRRITIRDVASDIKQSGSLHYDQRLDEDQMCAIVALAVVLLGSDAPEIEIRMKYWAY